MSRPSRRTAGNNSSDAWDRLPAGVKLGLERLVSDNDAVVRAMLSAAPPAEAPISRLCELCAGVMRQQKLSPAGFLSRFFDKDLLATHCALLGKSPKGGVPTLAERCSNAWLRGPTFNGGYVPKPKAVKATGKKGATRAASIKDPTTKPKSTGKKRKAAASSTDGAIEGNERAKMAALMGLQTSSSVPFMPLPDTRGTFAAAAALVDDTPVSSSTSSLAPHTTAQAASRLGLMSSPPLSSHALASSGTPPLTSFAHSGPMASSVAAVATSSLGLASSGGSVPTSVRTARCEKCDELFSVADNHASACFGHFGASRLAKVACERVSEVPGRGAKAAGSIWRLGCCGKVFPSLSSTHPSVFALWSADLAGRDGIGGDGCFKGLCARALDRGMGTQPHERPNRPGVTWEQKCAYALSVPGPRPISPQRLLNLRARFAVENVPWSRESATATLMKHDADTTGAGDVFGGVLDVGGYSDNLPSDLAGLF
eukprot:m.68739 g.68739  ORF g.68739 m.68739 type:complete len:484 (+) comp8534_c0_seq1:426-1877(+)